MFWGRLRCSVTRLPPAARGVTFALRLVLDSPLPDLSGEHNNTSEDDGYKTRMSTVQKTTATTTATSARGHAEYTLSLVVGNGGKTKLWAKVMLFLALSYCSWSGSGSLKVEAQVIRTQVSFHPRRGGKDEGQLHRIKKKIMPGSTRVTNMFRFPFVYVYW